VNLGEHDNEPIPGLPEPLPADERILWQGRPDWRGLARRAFHAPLVGAYFLLMALMALATAGSVGAGLSDALLVLVPGAAALGLLLLLARLNAGAAIFTITDRRLVLRFGVALPMTMNLPFDVIEAASAKRYRDGMGDIVIRLRGERVNYLIMWPFVRPFRIMQPQPMLRAVPEVEGVAQLLADALAGPGEGPVRVVPRAARGRGRTADDAGARGVGVPA